MRWTLGAPRVRTLRRRTQGDQGQGTEDELALDKGGPELFATLLNTYPGWKGTGDADKLAQDKRGPEPFATLLTHGDQGQSDEDELAHEKGGPEPFATLLTHGDQGQGDENELAQDKGGQHHLQPYSPRVTRARAVKMNWPRVTNARLFATLLTQGDQGQGDENELAQDKGGQHVVSL